MIVCFYLELIGIAYERSRLSQLQGRPLALASDGGVIVCASTEAQVLGVNRGLTTTAAQSFCRELAILPYDRAAYLEAAETVWDVIAVETNMVEPVEPELCYAEFTGPDIERRVAQAGASIAEHAGIAVRAGIGETKMIARAAAQRREKPQLDPLVVTEAPAGDVASLLAPIALASLSVLPLNLVQKLTKLGIRTLGDVRTVPRAEIERMASRTVAHRLFRLTNGQDDDPVRAVWPRQAIEACVVFDDEVSLEDPINAAIKQCAESISERLQAQYCRTVRLTVQVAGGEVYGETESLSLPVSSREQLTRAGMRLLFRLHVTQPILKVQLAARDIDSGGGVQLTLLDMNDGNDSFPHERLMNLESRVKAVRRKYGPGAAISAALLQKANQTGLWTYALAKLRDERVTVALDDRGRPIRYSRANAGCRQSCVAGEYHVTRILDQWRSAAWNWGEVTEVDCYRVFTEPHGTYELRRLGDEWRLRGAYD